MYWNPRIVLPYQRHFNFINGERSIGKTYNTEMFFIEKYLERKDEFVYLVRTQDEKKNGILKDAFAKVINNHFSDYDFDFTNDTMTIENNDGVIETVGHCLALSEYQKVKKMSFPNVKYLMFDEYMLESGGRYFNGWKEPDVFLNLYHTIDREEDRVICFLLGNTTTFYNPYHMHPAFNIPHISPGEIWKGKNVLFQWAVKDEELKDQKKNNKFLEMVQGTTYDKYANKGNYIEDKGTFIKQRPEYARHIFVIQYLDKNFGVWYSDRTNEYFIDEKHDPFCRLQFALSTDDHNDTNFFTRGKDSLIATLLKNYKRGNVKFASMKVKKMLENQLYRLL